MAFDFLDISLSSFSITVCRWLSLAVDYYAIYSDYKIDKLLITTARLSVKIKSVSENVNKPILYKNEINVVNIYNIVLIIYIYIV